MLFVNLITFTYKYKYKHTRWWQHSLTNLRVRKPQLRRKTQTPAITMSKFRAPDSFDFSQPAHWEEWITRWTRFRAITKLETETEEIQVSSLLYTMGPQSETVLNALRLSADDQKHYETVLAALNAYFKPKKYVIFERARFYRRNQMTGKPAEQFIRALYELADKCDFYGSQHTNS